MLGSAPLVGSVSRLEKQVKPKCKIPQFISLFHDIIEILQSEFICVIIIALLFISHDLPHETDDLPTKCTL